MYACRTDLKNKIKMMTSIDVVYPYSGILAIKQNEILSHATIWMNLENEIPDTNRQILYDSTYKNYLE